MPLQTRSEMEGVTVKAIVCLGSEDSSSITGVERFVDGGTAPV
jgi:hypothetical protein